MSALRIGALARQAGVSPDTLRHYERLGILPAPSRSSNGYREWLPGAGPYSSRRRHSALIHSRRAVPGPAPPTSAKRHAGVCVSWLPQTERDGAGSRAARRAVPGACRNPDDGMAPPEHAARRQARLSIIWRAGRRGRARALPGRRDAGHDFPLRNPPDTGGEGVRSIVLATGDAAGDLRHR